MKYHGVACRGTGFASALACSRMLSGWFDSALVLWFDQANFNLATEGTVITE